jgi:hypothetical protein
MGTLFRYVADDAIRKCSGSVCHHCEKTDIPLFSFYGTIIDPELAADPEIAREEPEVDELCAQCILSGNIARASTARTDKTIDSLSADPEYSRRELNKIPECPLILQHFDWPMCCGEWCEFTGSPGTLGELVALQKNAGFWDGGVVSSAPDFERDGAPESLREVSGFRCFECGRCYYIHQFT